MASREKRDAFFFGYFEASPEESVQTSFETALSTFNHANFAQPDGFVGDPNFGRIQSAAQISTNGDGRVVQLGGKFYF